MKSFTTIMVNKVSYDSEIISNSGIAYYGSSFDSTNSDGHAVGYLEVDLTEEVEKLILETKEKSYPSF